MEDDECKSGASDSDSSSNNEEKMSPEEYLRWLNATYGAPKFQEEMNHRTRHDRCGFPGCDTDHELWICSRCKIRQYCCTDHQRADWKIHKQYCRAPVVDFPGPEVNQCPDGYLHNMTHYGRAGMALKFAERLEEFIESDLYPPKVEELIYGVEMSTNPTTHYVGIDFPTGNLVYNVWLFLHRAYITFESAVVFNVDDYEAPERAVYQAKFLFRRHIAQAFLAGELPSWFQKSVEMYRNKFLEEKVYADAYVEELRRRNYKGIKWDNKILEQVKIWPLPGDPEQSPLSTDPYFWLNSSRGG